MENELSQNLLANLSLITALHNKNKPVLDVFLPIVKHAVINLKNKNDNEYCDIASLQEELKSQLGIDISELSLLTFLRRLEKEKVIELYSNKQAYKVTNFTDYDEYIEKIESKHRDINMFISSFIKYSDSKYDQESAKRLLFEFFGKYRTYIDSKLKVLNKSSISNEYEILLNFIEEINNTNNQLRSIFIDIYTGYCLCSVLTTTPNNNLGEKVCAFSNIKVYLDSNFILRLLDLQEDFFTRQTQELFESITAERMDVKIFDETVDEIKNVILYRGRQYFANEYDRNPTACRAAGVIGAIARNKMTWPQIQTLVDGLDSWLANKNITKESLRSHLTLVEQSDIDSLYKLKYQNDDFDEQETSYRRKKAETYCKIFNSLRKKNDGYKARLSNYKNLFLTCDNSVYSFSKQKMCGNYSSFVQNQENLSNALLLVNPQKFSSVVMNGLIVVLKTDQTFPLDVFAKWDDIYKTFAKEYPDKIDYVKTCIDDSECFSRVRDIMEEDSQPDSQRKEAYEVLLNEANEHIANEKELKSQLYKAEEQNKIKSAEIKTISEQHDISKHQLATTQQELDELTKEAKELKEKDKKQKECLFNSCNEDYLKSCKRNKALVVSVSLIVTIALICGTIAIGVICIKKTIGVAFTVVTGVLSTGCMVFSVVESKKNKVLEALNAKSKEKCFKNYNKIYGNRED